jgi:hypothetical protein
VHIVNSTPNIINDLWHYCNTFPIGIKTEIIFDYLHFFIDLSFKSFIVWIVKTEQRNETKTRTTPGYPTRKGIDIKQKWGCKCHPANPRAGQRRSLGLLPFEHMARTTKHLKVSGEPANRERAKRRRKDRRWELKTGIKIFRVSLSDFMRFGMYKTLSL